MVVNWTQNNSLISFPPLPPPPPLLYLIWLEDFKSVSNAENVSKFDVNDFSFANHFS